MQRGSSCSLRYNGLISMFNTRELDLQAVGQSIEDGMQLGKDVLPLCSKLKTLTLGWTGLGDEGVAAIAEGLAAGGVALEELHLDNTDAAPRALRLWSSGYEWMARRTT